MKRAVQSLKKKEGERYLLLVLADSFELCLVPKNGKDCKVVDCGDLKVPPPDIKTTTRNSLLQFFLLYFFSPSSWPCMCIVRVVS